jgi:hypothetical protein
MPVESWIDSASFFTVRIKYPLQHEKFDAVE